MWCVWSLRCFPTATMQQNYHVTERNKGVVFVKGNENTKMSLKILQGSRFCTLRTAGVLPIHTYSNTELSFWSPQMRISVMERMVSTRRFRLWSVTVVFLVRTWCMYLQTRVQNTRTAFFFYRRTTINLIGESAPMQFNLSTQTIKVITP